MIKILISGGAGNIGGALARKLVENPNYFVVIVDNLSTGSIKKLPSKELSNWTFVNCDVNNYTSISEEPPPPNTLFTSLVGLKVGRDHRFYIMNEIFKFNLNNDLNLAVTTEITKSIKNITICDYPLENDSPFIPIELTHFEPKEIILPSEVKNRNQIEIPTEYIDSSFDIVFETVYDYFFATEKTLRPIFEKKPFMVFASPNFHKKLQEKHGFMLFDNIIDYSFDSIMNTRDRYDSQIQQLVNIRNNYTPLEVFNATKEVVQYNYSRVLEMKTLNNDKIPSKYKEFLKDKLE